MQRVSGWIWKCCRTPMPSSSHLEMIYTTHAVCEIWDDSWFCFLPNSGYKTNHCCSWILCRIRKIMILYNYANLWYWIVGIMRFNHGNLEYMYKLTFGGYNHGAGDNCESWWHCRWVSPRWINDSSSPIWKVWLFWDGYHFLTLITGFGRDLYHLLTILPMRSRREVVIIPIREVHRYTHNLQVRPGL
jgi:hypothetical protein